MRDMLRRGNLPHLRSLLATSGLAFAEYFAVGSQNFFHPPGICPNARIFGLLLAGPTRAPDERIGEASFPGNR